MIRLISTPSTRAWRALVGLFMLFMLSSCGQEERQPQVPGLEQWLAPAPELNVLVVSFDALRADALGSYGYNRQTSPNIDQFANRSIVFENAYSAAPVTPTSFAAAFTGQYPFRVFIGWELQKTLTLASVMKNHGYRTFGLFNNVQLAQERNFDQGFESFDVANEPDETTLAKAKTLLSEHAHEQFFGWIHFISPHTPYRFRPMSSHLASKQDEGRFALTTGGHFEVESEQELKRARDLYDGQIFFADDLFAQLLSYLDELKLTEKTIIMLTSDHGEEFMEHGQLQHNSTYEEVIRIPMILYHPALETAQRTQIPYMNVDLFPMTLALAGIEQPAALDGLDLYASGAPLRHRIITGMTNNKRYEVAMADEGKKLMQICTPEFSEMLYDLIADPMERNDIVLDQPQMANSLFEELQRDMGGEPCNTIVSANRGIAPEQKLNDEQIEQLKSLGYIQ